MKSTLPEPKNTLPAPLMRPPKAPIPADNFVGTMALNVDNAKMSDTAFREFVRNTLSSVEYTSKCQCGQAGRTRTWPAGWWEAPYACDACWPKMLEREGLSE